MESKIIPLKGLKVEAIAVEIPTYCKPHLTTPSTAGNQMIYLESNGTITANASVYLPEGSWSILGRANELDLSDIVDLLYGKDYLFADEPIHIPIIQEWQSYCTANNLTNELILIRNG